MSQTDVSCLTDHAQLVVWGQYAHALGLIRAIQTLPLSQKTITHSPQSKILEFLVAILGGFEYLKDLSLSAHPLDKDLAVARAWGQESWADHSGVSRALSRLTETEVAKIAQVLEQIIQPYIDREADRAIGGGVVVLDGDLTPRAVSNTSQTYPEATYGHMHDRIRLGYQAAIVSLRSRTYGRLGLSAVQQSGKTESVEQAEALVLEAERRLGRRPRRRTELLTQRLVTSQSEGDVLQQRIAEAQVVLATTLERQAAASEQETQARQWLAQLETDPAQQPGPERPYSILAKARQQVAICQRRCQRRESAVAQAQHRIVWHQGHWDAWHTRHQEFAQRLQRFEADNAANPAPIQAVFRLDAGFGSPENLALLIEMGYDVYSKPYGSWLAGVLAHKRADPDAAWQTVGANAEMIAWARVTLDGFPYPLDLGCEHFWTGKEQRYSGLIHYGSQAVCSDLPGWFHEYNARQWIEAGNKESNQVFEMGHLKVRQRPALRLQEHLALFAANFVRLASVWLTEQCPQVPQGWQVSAGPQVKQQVKVAAHSPARVEWLGSDILLRFEDRSIYAGRSFKVGREVAIQLVLPWKIEDFLSI